MRYSLLPEYCLINQIMASRSGKYVTVPTEGIKDGRKERRKGRKKVVRKK